jgi:hypothetical protein
MVAKEVFVNCYNIIGVKYASIQVKKSERYKFSRCLIKLSRAGAEAGAGGRFGFAALQEILSAPQN